MSETCNQSCSSCSQSQKEEKIDFSQNLHAMSRVKNVIGIVSGKGGVGKSLTTSLLAVTMNRLGYRTAILDADITGPSIPKSFGITEKATANAFGMLPVKSKTGIDIMSVNLLLDNATDPVVWRGPIIAGVVKQFWGEVIWQDIDYMFIDMPPGTGDVPLTVFQSIPVDGLIVVTSPQELVSMIVDKAVKMAEMMNIPILGLVENMSYFLCPDNGKKYNIFGDSHIEEVSKKHGLELLAKLPIDPDISLACDQGRIEDLDTKCFESIANTLKKLEDDKMMKIAVASENDMVSPHFGHCQNFNIFEVNDKEILKEENFTSPGHDSGSLPEFLEEKQVNLVISGGMGQGAIDRLTAKGMKIITGAKGPAKKAVEDYLQGNLVSTDTVCQEHAHGHHH